MSFKHLRHYLQFDAEHLIIPVARRLSIVGGHLDPVLLAQRVPAVGAGMTSNDVPGCHQLALEDTGNDRLGHYPGPDDAQRRCPEWTPLRIVRSRITSSDCPDRLHRSTLRAAAQRCRWACAGSDRGCSPSPVSI